MLLVLPARAAVVESYTLADFTITDYGFGFGEVTATNGGATLVITGPNDGSGLEGWTDLTAVASAPGVFRFNFSFVSLDGPGFDYAGYLVAGAYYQLADASGHTGRVEVPVLLGQRFGFRAGTSDNTGEPGVFTVSRADAVPEPGTFWLAGAMIAAGACFRFRNRIGRLRFLRSAVALASVAAVAPVYAQTQAEYLGSSATGQMVLTRVVNLRELAVTPMALMSKGVAGKAAGEKLRMPPPRLRPPLARAPMAMTAAVAVAPSLSVVPSAAFGFNAISHYEQRLANNENQFSVEPPSQSIAVGNGYVLEGVNNAVRVYNVSGAPELPVVLASNQLFGLAPAIDWNTWVYGPYLTDMKVHYDPRANRWFVVQRSQDNDSQGNSLASSHLYLAVSRTGDPTGDYSIYVMETTNASHPGCPCIADYPQIGSDQYGFHISWNEFNSFTLSFVDAAILSLSKGALADGLPEPPAYFFTVPYATGYEFAIQPASVPPGGSNFLAAGGLEYFVSTVSRSSFGSNVAVWAMRNTSSLATGTPNMVLSRILVPTLGYTFPDAATQRPGPLPYGSSLKPPGVLAYIDGGDARVQSLAYAGGRLYVAMQTGVTDETGRWVVGGAYVVLSPTFRGTTLAASVLKQGYLVVNGNHLLRPALSVNYRGQGAIAVSLVGPDWYPSAAFIPFSVTVAPSTVEVAGSGYAPQDGFTGYPEFGGYGVARWGDYNGAVAAPDGAIWMVVQYIGNHPRTQAANWNTYVMRTP